MTTHKEPSREALVAVRGTRSYYHNNAVFGWSVAADGAVRHAA